MDENNNTNLLQQNVPGKQLNISHMIVNPDPQLLDKIGMTGETVESIGVFSITPSGAIVIAADIAVKYTSVKLEYLDRCNGSFIISGDTCSVAEALDEVKSVMCDCLSFNGGEITMT